MSVNIPVPRIGFKSTTEFLDIYKMQDLDLSLDWEAKVGGFDNHEVKIAS